jgi:hypothetical protein
MQPVDWILKGIPDVVKMNTDALFEKRKNAKENVVNVAPDLARMRSINKQNIACLELPEDFERNILNAFLS